MSAPLITDATERSVSFELAAHPGSAAQARRLTRAQLDGWALGEDTCEAATLVVSELVTNAIVHTGSRQIVCELRELYGDTRNDSVVGPSGEPSEALGTALSEDSSGHAGTGDGPGVTPGRRLRIAVRDEGCGGGRPLTPPKEPQDEHGRGLLLVAAMSSAWGAQETEPGAGLVVWAELPGEVGPGCTR
ncbi:ATP-binding protein [Streptomyces tsukubensis]|nr:ATP-binding protein [Streptomyces tsukubensis]QFR97595.1 ATP-binding protein [Streptomyces tsukubensis]